MPKLIQVFINSFEVILTFHCRNKFIVSRMITFFFFLFGMKLLENLELKFGILHFQKVFKNVRDQRLKTANYFCNDDIS